MFDSVFRQQIRLLEIYSITQGIFLAFLAAWFRFGPPVIHMEMPQDAASIQDSYQIFAYGLLAFILVAFFLVVFLKSKVRNKILKID